MFPVDPDRCLDWDLTREPPEFDGPVPRAWLHEWIHGQSRSDAMLPYSFEFSPLRVARSHPLLSALSSWMRGPSRSLRILPHLPSSIGSTARGDALANDLSGGRAA